MTPEQTKLLQTLVFLLDKNADEILKNDLMPYIRKAMELKELIERK